MHAMSRRPAAVASGRASPPGLPVAAECWAAVVARDAAFDGRFVYSVRSTGVFCRPSCPSRRARRENVAFHADAEAARRAGFRACRRCRPDGEGVAERQAQAVAAACRLLESAEVAPALAQLADAVGLSRWHLHRVFTASTGVTPRAYAARVRAERLRRGLATAGAAPVTAVLLDAGFGSTAQAYAQTNAVLGMSPSRWRGGGRGETIRFAVGRCSLGDILVAATPRGVCAILLGDDAGQLLHDLQRRFPQAELHGGDAAFEAWMAQVVGAVDRPTAAAAQWQALPLDLRGSAFQQRVWQALRAIPPGSTASYAEIAQRIGAPRAVRAVAAACAANPVAVAIPCHRVVRSDGGLSGYRWGVERKRQLLAREAGEG